MPCALCLSYLALPMYFLVLGQRPDIVLFSKKKKKTGEARVKSGTSTIWQRVKILILASGTFWDDCAHALVSQRMP